MLDLLVVRHAIAEDRESFARTGEPDELRPLTLRGRRRMQRAAKGLRALVPRIDVLATSPLVRAVQTAEIIADEYGDLVLEEVTALEPDSSSKNLLGWLEGQADGSTVAVVGHEPSLSLHVSWLISRSDEPFVEFKKGGACLLRFYDEVFSGGATLLWMLTPRQLRSVGG